MVDLVIIVLIIFIFFAMKYGKRQGENYLSIENSNALKGIFVILVVLHHLSLLVSIVDGALIFSFATGYLFPLLTRIGFLCVSIFFFLSGYGSYQQLCQKGEKYLDRYLVNKLVKIILPFIVVAAIYFGFDVLIYGLDKSLDILAGIVAGETIVSNGWYIIAILIIYFFFFVAFKFFKSFKYQIVALSLLTIAYMLTVILLGFGAHWYQNCFLFVVGVIWKKYELPINNYIREKTWTKIAILLFAFLVIYSAYVFIVMRFDNLPFVSASFNLILSLVFVPLIMLLITKVRIQTRYWVFLGSISLEIYILHGLAYKIIQLIELPSNAWGNLLFVLFSLGGAIAISLVFYYGKRSLKQLLRLKIS